MRRKHLVIAFTVISIALLAALGSAQEPQMPKPGPETKAMGFFEGKWKFEGKTQESPMGPAGPVTFTESCEWFDGGFALVCRSEGTNPIGQSKALSIMSWDPEKQQYTYYAVESGMPPFTATGKHEGKAWNWTTESKMGDHTMTMLVTVTEASPTSYSFEMKSSMDGGKTWTPIMEGKSTKVTS